MKQTNVRIPADVHRSIKLEAVRQGKSMAELLREALTEYAEALCKR